MAAGPHVPEDFHFLSPGRAATSGRAEPCHIGCHLPHGRSRNRGTDMQRAQKVSILNTVINSVIHGCETAGV